MPALSHVNSLDFACGIPWEFMHLLYENVVKNLIQLWKGKFKGLDEGTQDYVIPDHIWNRLVKKQLPLSGISHQLLLDH